MLLQGYSHEKKFSPSFLSCQDGLSWHLRALKTRKCHFQSICSYQPLLCQLWLRAWLPTSLPGSLVPRPKQPQCGSLPVSHGDLCWGCLGLRTRLSARRAVKFQNIGRNVVVVSKWGPVDWWLWPCALCLLITVMVRVS